MTNKRYLSHLKDEKARCEAMLETLESGKLLSGVSEEFHSARIHFMKRHVADLEVAIAAEEALDA